MCKSYIKIKNKKMKEKKARLKYYINALNRS